MGSFFSFLRPFLFSLPPEHAHNLSLFALRMGLSRAYSVCDKRLSFEVCGIDFPNPLGLAAGFDKNAEAVDALLRLGYGFCEIGTVTPRFQAGNPRPRLFRLEEDMAIINRMGFNNEGHDAVYKRLVKRKSSGIVGVNIGANKDSQDRIEDYVKGVEKFYRLARYLVINISSPNTPGLRNLQNKDMLIQLLEKISQARENMEKIHQRSVPMFLKISPDLTEENLKDIADKVTKSNFKGVIVSNTTIKRSGLKSNYAQNEGGLSGMPLFSQSTTILAKMRRYLGKEKAIIGVGGVEDAQTFIEKIKAGADLVQLYSAMIYRGPSLPSRILRDVLAIMEKDGIDHISNYRDQHVDIWADKPLCA